MNWYKTLTVLLFIGLASCYKTRKETEVSLVYYEQTVAGKWCVVMTDLKRIYVESGGEKTTSFEIIGPIAIIELDDKEADWIGAFTKCIAGGVWTTRKGNIEPNKIYYIGTDLKPSFIKELPDKLKKFQVKGDWSARAGMGFLAGEIFNRDKALYKDILNKIISQINNKD